LEAGGSRGVLRMPKEFKEFELKCNVLDSAVIPFGS
jgi:hypothetical protein